MNRSEQVKGERRRERRHFPSEDVGGDPYTIRVKEGFFAEKHHERLGPACMVFFMWLCGRVTDDAGLVLGGSALSYAGLAERYPIQRSARELRRWMGRLEAHGYIARLGETRGAGIAWRVAKPLSRRRAAKDGHSEGLGAEARHKVATMCDKDGRSLVPVLSGRSKNPAVDPANILPSSGRLDTRARLGEAGTADLSRSESEAPAVGSVGAELEAALEAGGPQAVSKSLAKQLRIMRGEES